MNHVVMFSGGVGSWAAARRLRDSGIAASDISLLFCDTLIEDEDLYRFLDDAAADIGSPLARVSDGRTPWQVFRDKRHIGNTRIANCSHVLKQDVARNWLSVNCDPANTTIYLGIDWSEHHRLAPAQRKWQPWACEAPLMGRPYLTKHDMFTALKDAGITPPRLYGLGFKHNNCGGFCVRAGQAQFKRLLEAFPERYAEHEREEEAMRAFLDKDVSILRDRRGGETKPLTLTAFREQVESADPDDWGGCGCFLDEVTA